MHFTKIIGSVVIISKNSLQYQYEAWIRNKEVFVKIGSGYAGLRHRGLSIDKASLLDYDLGSDHKFSFTKTGRLVTSDHMMAHYPADPFYQNNPTVLPEVKAKRERKTATVAKPKKKKIVK